MKGWPGGERMNEEKKFVIAMGQYTSAYKCRNATLSTVNIISTYIVHSILYQQDATGRPRPS